MGKQEDSYQYLFEQALMHFERLKALPTDRALVAPVKYSEAEAKAYQEGTRVVFRTVVDMVNGIVRELHIKMYQELED